MSRIFDCCRGDVLKMFKTGYSMKIFQGRNGTGAVGSSEDKGKEEGNLLMVCQFYAWAAISIGDAKNLSEFRLVPAPMSLQRLLPLSIEGWETRDERMMASKV